MYDKNLKVMLATQPGWLSANRDVIASQTYPFGTWCSQPGLFQFDRDSSVLMGHMVSLMVDLVVHRDP